MAFIDALCRSCARALASGLGPWENEDDDTWVRPPAWVSDACYLGSPVQAWLLNELTWTRLKALAERQRLTRHAIHAIADAQLEASKDPARQHVVDALGGVDLDVWAEMVESGWWPPAEKDELEEHEPTRGFLYSWLSAGDARVDAE